MITRKMQFPLTVRFVDKEIDERVRGFINIAVEFHLLLWTAWWRYRPGDEDREWNWWRIFLECKLSGGRFECYAATQSGNLEGLMALDITGEGLERAKPLLLIIGDQPGQPNGWSRS